MAKIFFRNSSNQRLDVEVNPGETLLDAAKKINIKEITGDCRGNCACGTCHVHISEEWIDHIEPIYIASLEPFLLEKSDKHDTRLSRLACQVEIKEEYDGLVIDLLSNNL